MNIKYYKKGVNGREIKKKKCVHKKREKLEEKGKRNNTRDSLPFSFLSTINADHHHHSHQHYGQPFKSRLVFLHDNNIFSSRLNKPSLLSFITAQPPFHQPP